MGRRDLVIVGGGLAGASLAIHVRQRLPEHRVMVLERQAFPVAEGAHKVGESTVEIGAHYFNRVLDLARVLTPAKIPKLGLRYFFPQGDNARTETRPELGISHYHPIQTTQFDRGRQENILHEQCLAHGVEFLDRAKVTALDLRDGWGHRVAYEHEGASHEVDARWLVDASGRRAMLRRLLDLEVPNDHAVHASWWRIRRPLAVDHMSDDPAWQARVPFGMRCLSTNHFMGRGYWVWLIPLACGSISIGIVADPEFHAHDEMNTFERSCAWLRRHEPGIAALMEPHLDELQDFRTLKRFSYGAKQVFSADRWGLTGEAGLFVDPFYSPGSDFIGISNTFLTEMIAGDVAGENLSVLARAYERQYMALYKTFLALYEHQYAMFGNAEVSSLKIAWDYGSYWGSTALLFVQGRLHDRAFMKSVAPDMVRVFRATMAAQKLFREWDALDPRDDATADGLLNYHAVGFLNEWLRDLGRSYGDDELRATLRAKREILEEMLRWIYSRASGGRAAENLQRLKLTAEDVRAAPRGLDMLDALDAHINARTQFVDGERRLITSAPAECPGAA